MTKMGGDENVFSEKLNEALIKFLFNIVLKIKTTWPTSDIS